MIPLDDGKCFGCGPLSNIGLKMRFDELPDGSVQSSVVLEESFQGWRGVAHGGIVALLLDEAMAYAAGARGQLGMTAQLKVRFREPVPLGTALTVRGNVLWQRRNIYGVEASVASEGGALLASGEGSFVSRGRLREGQKLGGSR